MRKNKLYIVLVILTITFLFATAAVCTQCGANIDNAVGGLVDDVDDSKKSAGADDNEKSADTDDSGKEEESKDTNGDKKDSDKKDEPKPEDIKIDDENKPPVISGIFLDSLDPVDYFFFANDTYTVRAEATDPEGGSLTFKWSGDGTIASGDLNPMTWTAPDTEGVYKITVEVTDEKGSAVSLTADIYVEINAALGEPPKGVEILDIEIVSNDGKYYKDTKYEVIVTVNDPLNEIAWYHFGVENTGIAGSLPDGLWEFTIPDTAGDIDIVVVVTIASNNRTIEEKTKTIYIEP